MLKKRTVVVLLVILILLAGVFFVFYQRGDQVAVKKIPNKPLKIALNVWPGYASAFVAQEKGFFTKNGVAVELLLEEDYAAAQKAYYDGEADGVLEVFVDTVTHNLTGKPTKVVYATDYSNEGDVIVGKSDIIYPSGLKEKKISIDSFGSFSHMFVSTILKQADLKPADVELVEVPAADVLSALESGKIDIGHTWEPTRSAALAKGYVQFDKAGNYPGLIIDVLSFSSEVIETRGEEVQAAVEALVEAADFVRSNPKEAAAIMAKAENMNEADMLAGLEAVHLLNKKENITTFSYSVGFESLHGTFRAISDFFREIGKVDKILDSTDYVDSQFIRNVK